MTQAETERDTALHSLGVLTRSTVHDLNNQMAAILGFAELVLETLPNDHPVRHAIDQIRLAGHRALLHTRELDKVGRELVPIGTRS